MARSPEASPQSPDPPGSQEAFLARVDSAFTSPGSESTGAHHDAAVGPTWRPEDQAAAVMDARRAVSAVSPTSQEPNRAETSHHPMATGGQWSHVPKSGASPAVEGSTEDLGALKPGASAVHKPRLGLLWRAANWAGLLPESDGVNTYVSPPEQQEPIEPTEDIGEVLTETILPPAGEWLSPAIGGSDKEAAGSPSLTDEVVAGAPSSESPRSPETPIVPSAEPPAVVGGALASLRRLFTGGRSSRASGPPPSGPPPSARRLPVHSTTSPSPQSPPEPAPWHASPTSPGEAVSQPTPVSPVYESRTPAVTALRAATTHNLHTIAPVEPLTVAEQPFGVLYANRALTSQERQAVGQYQEELKNYYDQMMSRFSRLLSPWALVDEWTGAADPAANEMIKGQVRHFGSLSNVATLSLLQGSENPNKARVSTISELPEVTIASIGGIRVQYAAKPWFVKTETGPDGTARTVVAVGTKLVKREEDARHINSDPLQVSPTAENTDEEYAVEYFVIPGEFTAATLGDARVTDMRPRGRDDDGTKWDRVAWDYTKLHHLTGIDPQELRVVAAAVNDIFNHASAPMPQQQDGMPPFMVYPEAGHLKVVKTAVANANDLATARQTAALAHQSAMSREAAGHQELLDTLAALRSSGTGGKKRKPR